MTPTRVVLAATLILLCGCSKKSEKKDANGWTDLDFIGCPNSPAKRADAMTAWRKRGQEGVPELIKILETSPSTWARADAATLIGEAGPRKQGAEVVVRNIMHQPDPNPDPVFALCDAFSFPDREVGKAAAIALGKFGADRSKQAFLLKYATQRPTAPHDIVALVPDLIASLGPDALTFVVDNLVRGPEHARRASVDMLRRLGKDAESIAGDIVQHDCLEVPEVVEALALLGEPARTALKGVAESGTPARQKSARKVLATLAGK